MHTTQPHCKLILKEINYINAGKTAITVGT